jgi:adenine-specific DNA-methyltransferase
VSRLNDLLRQLEAKDPALAKDLRQEYDALADRRAFGLNFERHTPEVVELPGRKIRKGDKVHVLPERGKNPTAENSRLWRVLSVDRTSEQPIAALEPLDLDPSVELVETRIPLADLVVAAEFRDPIYPGLVSTGKVERGGDKPFHTVINAENYHALQTLLFTHRGQVDCCYIDPPYNTGNEDWIYNDRYVAGDDHFLHSKWLAFMERRLLLAKELLAHTGVIIVSIGDHEHHRLRMLMDQIFGAEQYLATLAWQGGVSALAKHTGGGLDYMLVYAKDWSSHSEALGQWKTPKEGVGDVLAAAAAAWSKAAGDPEQATKLIRDWWRSNRKRFEAGLAMYDRIDSSGRLYRVSDLANGAPRPNLQYDLLHPVTNKPVRMHPNGWRHTRERMAENIAADLIVFGADHTSTAGQKRYLEDYVMQSPAPSFYRDRAAASRRLEGMLGSKRFPFPKDHEVLARWIRATSGKGATVLDFFGGSGSTVEAVMRLNEEDGGNRHCILVTNNEAAAADAKKLRKAGHRPGDPEWEAKGVYEYATKPRISTVATGIRPDGSTYSEGLGQNVEFFSLTYEAPLAVSSNREFAKIAPLLWMRAGSRGSRIDDLSSGWDVTDVYGVLADLDQTEKFLKAVAEQGENVALVFVVTDEDRLFQSVVRELPDHVDAVRLYEAYLRNFEIESGRSAL